MKNNVTYKINNAEWNDKEHSFLLLNVSKMRDGEEIEKFDYVSRDGDNMEPLNQILWDLAMSHKESIKESEHLQIIKGIIPPLPGFRVIDGVLFCDEEEKIRARMVIGSKLDHLFSGSVLAKAQKNPVFEKNRQAEVDALLELENQPDFPFNIVWPESEE